MTPTETVKLVGVIRQIWPSMKIDQYTPDAWHMALDDVTFDDALAAIRHLARSRGGYVQPVDIRRQIAEAAGLLPCAEADGLANAARVAGQQGAGASKLDEVTYRAYRAMGGPTAFDAPPSVIRPQWARVWADVVERYVEELLAGDLGRAVEARRALAIEADPGDDIDRTPTGFAAGRTLTTQVRPAPDYRGDHKGRRFGQVNA